MTTCTVHVLHMYESTVEISTRYVLDLVPVVLSTCTIHRTCPNVPVGFLRFDFVVHVEYTDLLPGYVQNFSDVTRLVAKLRSSARSGHEFVGMNSWARIMIAVLR